MIVNKREFTVEKDDGKVDLVALRPTQEIKNKAEVERAKAWSLYLKEGVILEATLWDTLRKLNLWDNEKENQLKKIDESLTECEQMLPDVNGKVKKKGVTLTQAREAAIKMRINRMARVQLLTEYTKYKNNTCEGKAESDKFNFLVSQCIVHADTKKPYFASLKDYLDKADQPDTEKAAYEFSVLYYNYDPDFDKNLPENQFLLKYKMCRDDLSLIDKDGDLVDLAGKKVDENGELLDKPVVPEVETFEVENDWNAE